MEENKQMSDEGQQDLSASILMKAADIPSSLWFSALYSWGAARVPQITSVRSKHSQHTQTEAAVEKMYFIWLLKGYSSVNLIHGLTHRDTE